LGSSADSTMALTFWSSNCWKSDTCFCTLKPASRATNLPPSASVAWRAPSSSAFSAGTPLDGFGKPMVNAKPDLGLGLE
jgi:hypothetical protein